MRRERSGLAGPQFAILGSLDVWDGSSRLELGGTLRERTLVMLLLEARRVVPVHRLVEAAWDSDPPPSAAHQIRKAVADLRQRIPGGADLIVTKDPGYCAVIGDDLLDLGQFRAGLRQARDAIQEGRPADAAATLDAAVALWRGPLLAGVGGPLISAASQALEEEYLAAVESLYDLRLEAGEAGVITPELRALVHRYPLRETLWERLMLALYRTSRQAEALEQFWRLHTLLSDELGIDPCDRVVRLYEQILHQNPDLLPEPPARQEPARPGEPKPDYVVPAARAASGQPIDFSALHPISTLPYQPRDFVGREAELNWIADAVERCPADAIPIIAVDGMGGIGKTSVVMRAARRLTGKYSDGQIFVDLCGFTPGQEPLSVFAAHEALLTAAGLPGTDIPSSPGGRTALWQALTAHRRLLLILDNAASAEQVRPLVPASPGCLTLITSRPRLSDLDGAEFLMLGPLSDEDGMEFLRTALGGARASREAKAAQEVLRLCGNLPLAVRIAAARLRNRPRWPIRRMVDLLRDETRRLAELDSSGRSVAAALRLSFGAMSTEQRTGFTLLGLHPGREVSVAESASLLDVDPVCAEQFLESLVDARLLEEGENGWYAFHDLVRSFAQQLAHDSGPRERGGITRLIDYYVLTAERACDRLYPERDTYGDVLPGGPAPREFATATEALKWLDRHRDTLLAAVALAHEAGLFRHAACLARELGYHSDLRNYAQDACHALETGVAAARRLGDPVLLRLALTNLSMQQWHLGRFSDGIAGLEEALRISGEIGDRRSEIACAGRLGEFHAGIGHIDRALRLILPAAQAERDLGMTREYATSLNLISSIHSQLGDFEAAEKAACESLELLSELGDIRNTTQALLRLGMAVAGQKRLGEALRHLNRAVELSAVIGVPANAQILAQLAEAHALSGDSAQAMRAATQALEQAMQDGLPLRQARVEKSVGNVFRFLGNSEEAIEHYQRALRISRPRDLKFETAQSLAGAAVALLDLGRTEQSRAYRRLADTIFAELGVPDDTASAS